MAEHEFRVTVEDLRTGERQVMEFAPGDYLLVPFSPCHRAEVQAYPLARRHVITISGYGPTLPVRTVSPTQGGDDRG